MCSKVVCFSVESDSFSAIRWSFSTNFVAVKRAGSPFPFASSSSICTAAWMHRCTAPTGSCSSALAGQKSTRPGTSRYLATWSAWSINSSMPSFFAAEIGTTGMPRISSNSLTRMEPPFARTSSIILRASTTGIPNSMICMVRYRFRSMLVASTILMIPSG